MEKDGDFFRIVVQNLMGDNPHFESDVIVLRTPLDTNRVLYLNREQESLVLDPFSVLERCPECNRPEVLLFDKFSDKKITYLGYESGHRPALETGNRLPLIIRDIATRQKLTFVKAKRPYSQAAEHFSPVLVDPQTSLLGRFKCPVADSCGSGICRFA
jgi:hypothetical protein